MKEKFAELIKVKTIVTLVMTGVMAALLLGKFEPSKELLALFAASYGSIMTYFFTKDKKPE
jgi:hypothetical protein